MRLKTFTARNMKEAMAEVRRALGPDAIIVASREDRGLVRVTAALDEAVAPTPPAAEEPAPAATAPVISAEPVDAILARHRVPQKLAASLVRAAAAHEPDDQVMALAAAFDAAFQFASLEEAPGRPLVFVGPPGAGKTATIAKVAARAVLGGRKAALITTDLVRAGAAEQLSSYGQLLEQTVTAAGDTGSLAAAVAKAEQSGHDLVLVDTPGFNPYDDADMERLLADIEAVGGEAIAVLAAGGDAIEIMELGLALRELGCRRFVATRLDTVRRFGSLLALAHGGGLAFAGVCASPYIGDPVESLNPVSLARLLAAAAKPLRDPAPRKAGQRARAANKINSSRTVVTS